MPKVEVELEDLEALVFASGAIKQIEAALDSRKDDPFVKPYLNLSDVHNRLAAVMRNAKRGESGTRIGWDEPLTKEEVSYLKEKTKTLSATPVTEWSVLIDVAEIEDSHGKIVLTEFGLVQSLMAKGCLIRGTILYGVKWDDKEKSDVATDKEGFMVKLTPRGWDRFNTARTLTLTKEKATT